MVPLRAFEVRESLLAGGATDTEIHGMAALFIIWATEHSEAGSDEWESQYELITTHLASTRVRITTNQADTLLKVEFPDRPRTH